MRQLMFNQDATFWYETLRSLGHIAYGGADFGEVVATADRIVSGDYASWHDEWLCTADRVVASARHSLAAGHRISARDAFLRAANYYRNAEFFLHGTPNDPRVQSAYRASVDSFQQATQLMDVEVSPVEIPYENATLPGYFYCAGQGRRPTVLMHNGFDGSAEEMHFVAAAALVERGYHVLSFDGPGQPGALHGHGLVFRPDWEHVVTPVLDHALSCTSVDNSRIALFGNSMGGLLASRAAAFEPRIAALVAHNGVVDMGTNLLTGDQSRDQVRHALQNDPKMDEQLAIQADLDPYLRWAFSHGPWVMGAPSPATFGVRLLDYRLQEGIAERITCPTLVCSGADDSMFPGQPEALYERLTCTKKFLEFTDDLGAAEHCQAGAARLTMSAVSDWLDDTLAFGGSHV